MLLRILPSTFAETSIHSHVLHYTPFKLLPPSSIPFQISFQYLHLAYFVYIYGKFHLRPPELPITLIRRLLTVRRFLTVDGSCFALTASGGSCGGINICLHIYGGEQGTKRNHIRVGSGPGEVWEWTEASADADGSSLEGRSQMKVLQVKWKFERIFGS